MEWSWFGRMQIAGGWETVQYGVAVKDKIFKQLKLALRVNPQQRRRPIDRSSQLQKAKAGLE
jgi:hypothetical protein